MILKVLKKVFYFLGSIKLAVPSMLLLMLVIATGTILESRYNADYARMMIYQTWWFNGLIITIWFNILFATLTRLPWKKHHIGFLITHLGLLLLFGGGFLTNVFGVDGTLRVMEGESSRYVVLPDLVFSVRSAKDQMGIDYPMTRWTSSKTGASFGSINEKLKGLLTLTGYEPFVEAKEVLKIKAETGAIQEPFELQFQIKSNFFDVQQSLNSQGPRSLQMGPASFRLIKEGVNVPVPKAKRGTSSAEKAAPKKSVSGKPGTLIVKVGDQLKEVKIAPNAVLQISGYEVRIKRVFTHATVISNGLQENPSAPVNPALEVEISKGQEKVRDILFAKYPGFSIRKDQFPDLQLEMIAKITEPTPEETAIPIELGKAMPEGHPSVSSATSSSADEGEAISSRGNQVLFYYSESHPNEVKVELRKNGQTVETKNLKSGEKFLTPWMGMELTISQMAWNAQKEMQVVPTTPAEKTPVLPPSAIRLNRWEGAPADEAWLVEGEEKNLNFDGKQYVLYYGRKIIELPFSVSLKEFKKTDYPGTSMAKEYESHVQVSHGMNSMSSPIRISMNQPLQEFGYTLYQASYEEIGAGKFASILSVNLDPGRWFKYFGGLILAIGIITYTLSKSRRFKSYFQ